MQAHIEVLCFTVLWLQFGAKWWWGFQAVQRADVYRSNFYVYSFYVLVAPFVLMTLQMWVMSNAVVGSVSIGRQGAEWSS